MLADNDPTSALMRLYLEKRSELVRFFTARTGSPIEAEDVVQELFFKVKNAPGAEIGNGAAYLYRLGLNLMVDRQRSQYRSRRRDLDYLGVHNAVSGGEYVAETPTAEDVVDARQRLSRLMREIEKLPPQCRRVFLLHKIEGLSHAQVADRLSISRSAVEKHIITALRRLAGGAAV